MLKSIQLYFSLFLLVYFAYFSQSSFASEMKSLNELPSTTETIGKYVSISFQVYGLEESAETLKEATIALSDSIKAFKQQNELTPAQLKEMQTLVDKLTRLAEVVHNSASEIKPAIENAKEPTMQFINDVVTTARTSAGFPTVEEFDQIVRYWIFTIGAIVLTSIALLLLGLWRSLSLFRESVKTLNAISTEYEIVFASWLAGYLSVLMGA